MASEVYSVGVLLYHLATGSYPVTGRTVADLRAAHAARRTQPGPICGLDAPRELVRVLERALAIDPVARYATIADFAAALDAIVERTSGGGEFSSSPPRTCASC